MFSLVRLDGTTVATFRTLSEVIETVHESINTDLIEESLLWYTDSEYPIADGEDLMKIRNYLLQEISRRFGA